MRNYSFSNSVNFVSIDTNCSEYLSGNPDDIFPDIVAAVAKAMGCDFGNVWRFVEGIIVNGDDFYSPSLSSSEMRCLVGLCSFLKIARERFDSREFTFCENIVTYVYSNVNEGYNVVWASVVN